MCPRIAHRPVLTVCLAFIATAFIISSHTENAIATPSASPGVTKGYCASEPGGSVVYVSNVFDAVTQARTKISTAPLNFAFRNYLVEQYDFKSSSNYPADCSVFETLSQAEANRRQIISQAQQAKKQVVEVNWNPAPLVEVPYGEGVTIGPKGPPPTHTFCALGNRNTMYFSAVFDSVGVQPDPKWNNAFNNFLSKNYAAEGEATCTIMNTVREAERTLKARVGGVRANNHKAIETGWKFDPSDLAGNKARPKPAPTPDDDAEPVAQQRPAAPAPPSQSSKDAAVKELPLVLEYCQKDPMLSKIFDCYRVQRSVYNYRMKHGNSEPLASLFTQEKVNLADAIGTGLNLWVRSRTTAQGISNIMSNCIEQKVAVSFRDKPYISKLQEIYNASVAACKP